MSYVLAIETDNEIKMNSVESVKFVTIKFVKMWAHVPNN